VPGQLSLVLPRVLGVRQRLPLHEILNRIVPDPMVQDLLRLIFVGGSADLVSSELTTEQASGRSMASSSKQKCDCLKLNDRAIRHALRICGP
jgi:hypothetical protein